jgi:protein tyrosine phosphatase (PTP) superfamily phosphohydrolase (DUF442 family)
MSETSFLSRIETPHVIQTALRTVRDGLDRRPALRHGVMLTLWTLIWLAVIALPILIYAGGIQLTGNIDTVVRGKLYRSATLSASDLTAVIRAAHIRTVINLRGANPGQSWYQDEIRVTDSEHVRRIDLPLSAIRVPGPALLGDLISALQTAETPILIHCSSGSDRTGLAAALYEMIIEAKPAAIAREQLSFYWGHFPYVFSPTIAMDKTFAMVAADWEKSHPAASR